MVPYPQKWRFHYSDVKIGAMGSQITSLAIVFAQSFIQTHIKENIKAPRHWHSYEEFTGDRRNPRTKGSKAKNVSIW